MPPMAAPPPEAPTTPALAPPPELAAPPIPPPPIYVPPPATAPLAPLLEAAPSRIPAYVIWGAAGASLVVGAVLGFAAISAKSDFDDRPTYDRADTVHSRAVAADVALGLGLVLAATGTVFFFSGGSHEAGGAMASAPSRSSTRAPAPPRLRIDPMVGRTAGGGALTMQF
jgi:hypothetical protein